ncbi:1-acyl-sn-glycerol-3-phosphate acyltransferase [Gleimia sp. 6138-11-ORH1]|uniref:lysophospholipid acyltransferase family protein n=1 Tax=Gleimia sp. 6138-11-ORH1 TaxID=2973937 RepID=UPI002169BDE9|nr:lysophospholipid acyltransferase family protein [Gleimia sp. 6138-11-ORH1]MCS4484450.1 1-acyl-sn-glycerol-3-phosphate acyltransferase [Gleimia sp. 6138-11-ORH1]
MLYQVLKKGLGPLLKAYYKPWIEGKEQIPTTGAAILASNHLAVFDSVFLPLLCDRQIVFIGKDDYFKTKTFKGRVIASFMRGVGVIPVDRSSSSAAESALNAGLGVLKAGQLFGIYPEGTRSPDGKIYKAKVGVAKLAIKSGAPVIPIAMIGTDVAQPIGQRIPTRHPVGIRVGEPLDFSHLQGKEDDGPTLRAVANQIIEAIQALSGQEYVDMYAADRKLQLAAEGKFAGPIPSGAKTDRPQPAAD